MTDAREGMEKHWDEMDNRKRMQESEDATMRCTGGHGDADEVDEIVDAIGSTLGHMVARYPLSFLWMLASILIGFGTGYLFSWVGAGLGSMVIGWLVLRMIRAS